MMLKYNLYTVVVFVDTGTTKGGKPLVHEIRHTVAAFTAEDAYFQVDKFLKNKLTKEGYLHHPDIPLKIIDVYPKGSEQGTHLGQY
jgi:hypothetical protein